MQAFFIAFFCWRWKDVTCRVTPSREVLVHWGCMLLVAAGAPKGWKLAKEYWGEILGAGGGGGEGGIPSPPLSINPWNGTLHQYGHKGSTHVLLSWSSPL